MSTRLTQELRKQIVHSALDHRFAAAEREDRAAEEKLFSAVRLAMLGQATMKKIDALPTGWLPLHRHLLVGIDGHWCDLTTAFPVRMPCDQSRQIGGDKLPERLQQQLRKHFHAGAAARAARRQLNAELTTALKSFATLESLHRRWPQMTPFTKGIEPAATQLPAIPMAHINAQLGIAS